MIGDYLEHNCCTECFFCQTPILGSLFMTPEIIAGNSAKDNVALCHCQCHYNICY